MVRNQTLFELIAHASKSHVAGSKQDSRITLKQLDLDDYTDISLILKKDSSQ
jgi:hypothetical protein